MNNILKPNTKIPDLLTKLPSQVKQVWIFNFFLVAVQIVYFLYRRVYLNQKIPFWYTKPWGEEQLADKNLLILIPLITLFILAAGLFLTKVLKKYYIRYYSELTLYLITFSNLFLAYSFFRIFRISTRPFEPFINPLYFDIALPFITAFLIVYAITPKFIKFMEDREIVTDPSIHKHPGMSLAKPSARGAGFVFAISFIATSLFFVPQSTPIAGILLASGIFALMGIVDDYQNTHIKSKFKFLENPLIRLLLLMVTVIVIILFFGIRTDYIGNPLGGVIQFAQYKIQIGNTTIEPLSAIFTTLWIVWVLNLLSWSNGIDGQYSGIIGIVGIIIVILSLRFIPLQRAEISYAKLAIIMSGASLGLVYYMWHPSKIMWGFGATSAGIVVAALSILVTSKAATAITIMMVPFLDALVTIIRRIIQRKNPLRGDKGHLHHLLMERGWSVRKIALFYWGTTALFGFIGIAASEKVAIQVALTLGGLVAFGIILLNLKSITNKKPSPQAVK
ncbi:hypothetical protein A2W32_03830 [candidate division WWE3 bacterium RBG_16_37_10]|uniref:Undecaprenyl-phosphate alpha-N-acetylglucosaminyl 1-phosphate transferase n=1 Tax=candidate division WWE3 bacterium RBG_16_37_10 TaxID=1802610 RepID=A0A1F4UZ06_UNCKA|nr:MAG: hypothetical protein A2W32_03830 [candidate division WWE3 bacterium RBG_16_37_10]